MHWHGATCRALLRFVQLACGTSHLFNSVAAAPQAYEQESPHVYISLFHALSHAVSYIVISRLKDIKRFSSSNAVPALYTIFGEQHCAVRETFASERRVLG